MAEAILNQPQRQNANKKKHLQRYATKYGFRGRHRASLGYTDVQRADAMLAGIAGQRPMYRHTLQMARSNPLRV